MSLMLLSIFLPVIAGGCLLFSSFQKREKEGKRLHLFVGSILVLTAAMALFTAWQGEHEAVLFYLMEGVPIYFKVDSLGRLFVTFVSIVWVAVGIYSFVYMKKEGGERRFFGLYLLVYGILIALDFSGNLVTMYLFYELMTLASMPLVLHNGSREAIMAALKYLFYSMCGAVKA